MGATIRVAHQANGTITDIDGKFSIFVPSGKKSEIIVSYVGYATQTLEVSAETTNVKVDMKVNAGEFDEVVVIGYGTAKKTGLTASVETLSGDDLLKIPAINIDQSLAGQAAGLGVHAYSGDRRRRVNRASAYAETRASRCL